MSIRCLSIVLCSLSVVGLAACDTNERRDAHGETEEYCRSVKPGVITSVNTMCAVMVQDPVDPALTPIDWKGQKVGFCCQGCVPDWEKMTDSQKDASLAKAVANSRK